MRLLWDDNLIPDVNIKVTSLWEQVGSAKMTLWWKPVEAY
jgi:hypothetical protein